MSPAMFAGLTDEVTRLPTAQWDVPAVIQDLTAKLMEAAK